MMLKWAVIIPRVADGKFPPSKRSVNHGRVWEPGEAREHQCTVSAYTASLFCLAGTTCLIALLSDKDLTVANVGDSRGVLCDKDGNAIPLSHDHKPYQLKERKRIKRAGEFVSPLEEVCRLVWWSRCLLGEVLGSKFTYPAAHRFTMTWRLPSLYPYTVHFLLIDGNLICHSPWPKIPKGPKTALFI